MRHSHRTDLLAMSHLQRDVQTCLAEVVARYGVTFRVRDRKALADHLDQFRHRRARILAPGCLTQPKRSAG